MRRESGAGDNIFTLFELGSDSFLSDRNLESSRTYLFVHIYFQSGPASVSPLTFPCCDHLSSKSPIHDPIGSPLSLLHAFLILGHDDVSNDRILLQGESPVVESFLGQPVTVESDSELL